MESRFVAAAEDCVEQFEMRLIGTEDLLKGKKTLNHIRKEFGLEPISDEEFNVLITKA